MRDFQPKGAHAGLSDPDLTPTESTPADAVTGESPRIREAWPARHDTPLLPASLPPPGDSQAILTMLTGLQAGRLVAINGAPVTIGTAADSDFVVEDFGVSRHHARIARTGENAYSIEDLGSTNGTYLRNQRVDIASLHAGDLLQLGPELRLRFATLDLAEATLYQGLYESSMQDPLTRAFNRRYLNDRLFAEIAHAQRTSADVFVLMIDVDGLKEVNDRFGHLAGDRALSSIATRIQSVLRAEDLLARYGGDEFVVLALGTVGVAVLQLAERIRHAVEGLQMSARGRIVSLTASIGVASLATVWSSTDPAVALLAVADARMYAAKASGRNRVCSVDPPPGNAPSGTWRDA